MASIVNAVDYMGLNSLAECFYWVGNTIHNSPSDEYIMELLKGITYTFNRERTKRLGIPVEMNTERINLQKLVESTSYPILLIIVTNDCDWGKMIAQIDDSIFGLTEPFALRRNRGNFSMVVIW